MVKFGFTYDPSISLEQRVGFELAAMIWSSYLTDEVTINLHIGSSSSLGEEGQAVGGAIPIFHEQHYGIYQEYLEADATSDIDESAVEHLQAGNTVDFLVNGQLVDGNTNILLTSAQAKALGMDEALTLDNGGTWDRDLVDDNALDGYILVSNAFEWNYDYTRSGDAPEGTLDFMSMALHEIGHQLGFVSGLDGSLDLTHLHSGETQATGFTALDLFRHSLESGEILNPDGAVSDLSVGQSSYFSVDGGETNLGDFSDGVDYQASHWSRLQVAMGIMDPTLAYQERTSLGLLDLQAMDALGWDVNYSAIRTGLDIDSLLLQAEQAVAEDLGIASSLLTDNRGQEEDSNFYTLGYGELWQLFEKSMLALGYGELWQAFELGYGELWQEYGRRILNLGYGELWQLIEENIFKLGYGELWQKFETEMLELGYGELWQKFETEMLELGYGELWQKLDEFFAKVDKESSDSSQTEKIADGGVGGQVARIFRGGDADDIISGDKKQDRIKAGGGDDLIDGKGGHDVIWGEAGRDMIYGQDGNDLLYGGGDEDLILGETGDDKLHGEAGDDIASGGSGDDIVTGGEGKDDLKGGTGRDVLSGDEGHDRLDGEAGNDIVIGGKGRDQVSGGSGNDILYGDSYAGSETLKQLRRQLKRQPAEVNENTAVEAASSNNELNPIRVEAEDMNLSGDYAIRTNWGNDSGETLRVLSTATATTTFTGPSGNYMVVARYFDENENGDYAALNFNLNGSDLNQFILDQETGQFHTQTVAQNLVLNSGDVFTVTATVEGKDNASFDYLEFVSLDNLLVTQLESSSTESIVNIDNNTSDNTIVRVEAESMTLIGDYSANSFNTASNGQVIELSDQGHGKALTAFSGETGFYNVVVGYYDDNKDGIGQISALLDGVELDTWRLDQNLATSSANVENLTTRTVASGIALSKGDIFKLVGMRGESNVSDEATRIDYVEFIKVDTPTQSAVESGLVAHWSFDEAAGNTVTDSINGLSGTLHNMEDSDRNQGAVGQSINFDGVNEHGIVDSAEALTLGANNADFSVSFWLKLEEDSTGSWRKILHKGETNQDRTFGLWTQPNSNRIHYRISTTASWNEGGNSQKELTVNQWTHVSYVKEDNKLSLYLDGQLDSSVNLRGEVIGNDGPLRLGSTGLDASLDDLRLYDRALTQQDVSALNRMTTITPLESGLVAHW
ncbi:MAG: NF038122 family metalloprotease, partial [Cyanobacteria bacterium P01_D01_bin.105]